MGKIVIGKVAFTPQGAHDSSVTYAKYDMVYEDLLVYISLKDANTSPLNDATSWKVLMGIDKVLGRMLADGSITTDKIGAGEVKSGNIGQGEVKSANIEDGAVSSEKMSDGTVTSEKIGAGEVKSRHIEDGAVTSEKIGAGEVKSQHIAAETLTRDLFAPGAIDNVYAIFRKLVEEFEPVCIRGNVTNAADEEDLTAKDGLLKLRDRLPLYGMGRKLLRRRLVDVYPDDVWAFKKVGDVVYLLYTVDNVWYGVYDSVTGKGLVLANNLVAEVEGYDATALPEIAQGHSLSYTSDGGVYTVTLPDGDTITSTTLNGTEMFYFDAVTPEHRNDVLTDGDLSDENTVYVVQYDFSLGGRTVRVPRGCAILFAGGRLTDGTLVCADTLLVSELYYDYMDGVTLVGRWQDETSKSLQDQINAIVSDKATVALTVSPSAVFADGTDKVVTLTAMSSPTAADVRVEPGVGEAKGVTRKTWQLTLNETSQQVKSYTASFVIAGVAKGTKSAAVSMVYPIYYGSGASLSEASMVASAEARATPAGEYSVSIGSLGDHLFFEVPYGMRIGKLQLVDQPDFPTDVALVEVATDRKGADGSAYTGYMSVGTFQAGSHRFRVS